MVYLPSGSTSNLLKMYLSFSTLYSSSLGRTDTIVFSQLISPRPASNGLEINKPPRGLNRGFTVLNLAGSTVKWTVPTFLLRHKLEAWVDKIQ